MRAHEIHIQILEKTPAECSQAELISFRQFVEQGGEVQRNGLEGRIQAAISLVFLSISGKLCGVAALKRPNEGYRDSLFENAGVRKEAGRFNQEIGWIFIAETARGNRLSSKLVEAALRHSGGLPIFATTSEDNKRMQATLERYGFHRIGNPYVGREDRKLLLYVND